MIVLRVKGFGKQYTKYVDGGIILGNTKRRRRNLLSTFTLWHSSLNYYHTNEEHEQLLYSGIN